VRELERQVKLIELQAELNSRTDMTAVLLSGREWQAVVTILEGAATRMRSDGARDSLATLINRIKGQI
jgi:hypothetical protein